jgi:hypothetical protein
MHRFETAARFVRDDLPLLEQAPIVAGAPVWEAVHPTRIDMPLELARKWKRLKGRSKFPLPADDWEQVRQEFGDSFLEWISERENEPMPDGLRLNLGSGWHYLDGFLNVDLHHDADVKADLRTFDCLPDSAAEILSTHVIEHFTEQDGRDLIARCYRWLRPGGKLILETPDREKCLRLLARRPLEGAKGLLGGRSQNKPGWHEFLIDWVTRGADLTERIPTEWDLPGEAHLHVWTGPELSRAMAGAGFVHTEVHAPQHHGGRISRDTRVVGMKG